MRRTVLFVVAATAAIGLICAACSSDPPLQPCRDIPDGGCPVSDGVACEDPTCHVVYACTSSGWVFQSMCPSIDGGIADATFESDAPEGPMFDAASIDAPPGSYGGPGCPDLEEPDCPLGVAIACGVGCCDCEDLYVCVDMGWTEWGECTPDAGIVETN